MSQLAEAGLRELAEETGLELKVEDCRQTQTIALWEVSLHHY